ncbi:MAG: RimK family alpha-L-glutamate ligase [Nanoarchaeota archaeon]
MKAAIISLGSESSQLTAVEMRSLFDVVDEIDIRHVEVNFSGKSAEVLYKGKPLQKYHCVYPKGSFRFSPLLRTMTEILGDSCYIPIRPSAFTVVHDKLLTQLALQIHRIPMPKTYLAATVQSAKEILDRVNYPIILKFPQGTQGKGVMYAESYASASTLLDALTALKQPFLIQEFVDAGGRDYRLIVVGDKVVAAYQRRAQVREMRANIHQGGTGEPFEPDAVTKKLAVLTSRCIHAEICGVDILPSARGPLVLEANISPGLQGVQKVTKINVARIIAQHLFDRTKAMQDQLSEQKGKDIMDSIDTKSALDIISTLDLRGDRVFLPHVVTKLGGFNEMDSYRIKVEKDRLNIEKFKV